MPFELARRASAHRMLERLQNARRLQILERLHSFHEKLPVWIALGCFLCDSFEHMLVPLRVLRRTIQENLELHPPCIWVAVGILRLTHQGIF